jgi:hypothetical protein
VLRVEVTDDDGVDPFFLFLWSVSEEEFHELKAQQRLLVDFASFPANLIELLECCLKDSKWLPSAEDQAESSEDDKQDGAPDAKADVEQARAQMSRSQGPVPLRCALFGPSSGVTKCLTGDTRGCEAIWRYSTRATARASRCSASSRQTSSST